jgi:hypothetical protein
MWSITYRYEVPETFLGSIEVSTVNFCRALNPDPIDSDQA